VLISEAELGLGLVGLGKLTEFAAMTLWADAQARALCAGTGGTLRDVVDAAGTPLYPGFFWTHVTVPPDRRLERFAVWDRIAVGVDVQAFGPILASSYVLGTPAELEATERPALPAMRGAAMFFAPGKTGEPVPASPKQGTVAPLAKAETAPPALAAFKEVRLRGAIDDIARPLRLAVPIACPIVAGRDAAPGHTMAFAQFVRLFDAAERALLSELRPPAPAELVDHLAVIDREVYYLDNCGAGAVVAVDAAATIARCPPELTGTPEQIAALVVEVAASAHEQTTGQLLALSRVQKLLVVPRTRPSILHAAERLCRRYT
jgi:probable biosynthetic protein (TIGR04098 family)